jgi:tetrapyrrole methylase family protein/MazG family protein
MVDFECKENYNVEDLRRIVKLLRGEGGCPWDIEQTHESIRRDFLEETYEVIEAIDEGSTEHLQEELGDVLLQVVFHTDIEEDAGHFDLDAVADGVCKKLILRHPHVFGDVEVSDSAEVLSNWDKIKRVEKKQETVTSALDAVAKSLPSLWRAEKLQKKAGKAGYPWGDINEAISQATDSLNNISADNAESAIGELLFSAVRIARAAGVDPEIALKDTCDKFIAHFSAAEKEASDSGKSLEELDSVQWQELWSETK